MKYKHIRSATHNLIDSFLSCMNHVDGDDALVVLGRRAFDSRRQEFTVNWLTGRAAPDAFLSAEMQWLIDEYVHRYPPLLAAQRCSIEAIRSAMMSLRFDLESVRDARMNRWMRRIVPYRWRAVVIDDRGKEHTVERSWEVSWFVD
jgi:hypothetical protein